MPYDADGNYTAVVQPTPAGFVNVLAPPPPNPGRGPMTAAQVRALIDKELG